MSNNVNKNLILQRKIKNVKMMEYDLNNKELLTFIT